jgi:hypothetical protein
LTQFPAMQTFPPEQAELQQPGLSGLQHLSPKEMSGSGQQTFARPETATEPFRQQRPPTHCSSAEQQVDPHTCDGSQHSPSLVQTSPFSQHSLSPQQLWLAAQQWVLPGQHAHPLSQQVSPQTVVWLGHLQCPSRHALGSGQQLPLHGLPGPLQQIAWSKLETQYCVSLLQQIPAVVSLPGCVRTMHPSFSREQQSDAAAFAQYSVFASQHSSPHPIPPLHGAHPAKPPGPSLPTHFQSSAGAGQHCS